MVYWGRILTSSMSRSILIGGQPLTRLVLLETVLVHLPLRYRDQDQGRRGPEEG